MLCGFCRTSQVSHNYTYIYIHTSPPSWASSHPPSSCPLRLLQSARMVSLGYMVAFHWLPILYMVVYICQLLSQFAPPFPSPLCPQVHSLCLCLSSCPANRFISTVLLDSIYVCVNLWYLFFSFWLTSLCIPSPFLRWIHWNFGSSVTDSMSHF